MNNLTHSQIKLLKKYPFCKLYFFLDYINIQYLSYQNQRLLYSHQASRFYSMKNKIILIIGANLISCSSVLSLVESLI